MAETTELESSRVLVTFHSDEEETPKTFHSLLQSHKSLKNKHQFDTHEFQNILIFCKKTMQLQDDQVRRLEELIEFNEKSQKSRLLILQNQAKTEIEELQLELERMKSENLLMMTQIGNQQQMELEMTDMRKEMKELKLEISKKDERMNKRELREREIALVTEQKVRQEVQKEFDAEIEKIAKELRIQNAAQIKANNHIINKLNKEILSQKTLGETTKLKMNETVEELGHLKKENSMLENDKKRLEEHLSKASQQTEKLLKDTRKQLEDFEKLRIKETTKNAEFVTSLKKEIAENKKLMKEKDEMILQKSETLKSEKELRENTLAKHADQNEKLQDLKTFLKIILEDNNDDYVDAMLGENRVAVFEKLSLLLQRIPFVQ